MSVYASPDSARVLRYDLNPQAPHLAPPSERLRKTALDEQSKAQYGLNP
jgi:hypothetical protein